MLVAVRRDGSRPPFFLVHGLYGLANAANRLKGGVSGDQPLYELNARGFDGTQPPWETVEQMAADYVEEILRERPTGAYLIGGDCQGGLAAVEVARQLTARGRRVGAVLLLDPGHAPFKSPGGLAQLERGAAIPAVRHQLHEQSRSAVRGIAKKMAKRLFDPDDPRQLEIAAAVGAASALAFARHVPAPFAGPTVLILSTERAAGFFEPEHAWQQILPGPRTTHVIEGDHMGIMQTRQSAITRLIRVYLDTAFDTASDPAATVSRVTVAI